MMRGPLRRQVTRKVHGAAFEGQGDQAFMMQIGIPMFLCASDCSMPKQNLQEAPRKKRARHRTAHAAPRGTLERGSQGWVGRQLPELGVDSELRVD